MTHGKQYSVLFKFKNIVQVTMFMLSIVSVCANCAQMYIAVFYDADSTSFPYYTLFNLIGNFIVATYFLHQITKDKS